MWQVYFSGQEILLGWLGMALLRTAQNVAVQPLAHFCITLIMFGLLLLRIQEL